METYRIGEIAARSGVTVETLRYYERLGLLPPTPRTKGGARRYDAVTVQRVRFIKEAQTLGLALNEIRDALSGAMRRGASACAQTRVLLEHHIADLDRRIAQLREHRDRLHALRMDCESSLDADPSVPCARMVEVADIFAAPRPVTARRSLRLNGHEQPLRKERRGWNE